MRLTTFVVNSSRVPASTKTISENDNSSFDSVLVEYITSYTGTYCYASLYWLPSIRFFHPGQFHQFLLSLSRNDLWNLSSCNKDGIFDTSSYNSASNTSASTSP